MKKHPDNRPGLHQLPPAIDCGRGYSWLPFFLMALGVVGLPAQAQEQVLGNYYWIRPQEELVQATRVIKVHGEKGEKYNEVFSEASPIQNHASIQQARQARLRAMRQEARELARKLQEAGKTPEVAYEAAWNQVYTRNRLNANGGEGDKRLNSLLRQLVEGNQNPELSDEDAQWLLEALMEDDSRLDSAEGRLLLRKLLNHLRASSLEQPQEQFTTQDELMLTFADALASGMDSMDAYRDALFKVNRGFIMNHPLVGYCAPWGLGLGRSKAVYQQAKNPIPSQTISSANTQAQTEPSENLLVRVDEKQTSDNVSAGLDSDAGKVENFLASSPLLPEEDEPDEAEKELEELEETSQTEPKPNVAAPAFGPSPTMMRSFSLRSAAAPVADSGSELPSLTWAGSTGNDKWLVNGDSAATPWQGNTVFTDGSHVIFSSTTAIKDVQLDGTVRPGSITVSGDTPSTGGDLKMLGYNYAFTGNGSIADYIGGATSINVEDSATLVLNTANTFSGGINLAGGTTLYLGCDDAAGTGAITMGNGAKLIVNYNSTDTEYRSPSVANALNLSGTTAVSFGTASYEYVNIQDNEKVPCEWRTLNLTGGVTGSGTLELRGYTYLSKSEDGSVIFNYVSDFAVNRQNAGEDGFFTGTVKLKNEFNSLGVAVGTNHEMNTSIKELSRKVLAGAVQLTLVDDVFSQATLNLTRDVSENRIVGHNSGASDAGQNNAVTSDNIVLLSNSSQIKLKALEADFLNRGWKYDEKSNNGKPLTLSYGVGAKKNYSQADERWNVRIVTDGYTNLVLEDSSNTEHVFSGSMGFAHSYVNSTQAYIGAKDPADVGGGSKGVENLSLEKRGAASQYIHSAKLYNLSIAEGTLGFNNLAVSGRLLINAGSELRLGVTDVGTGTNAWANLSGVTNTSLTVGSGQLEVRTSSASKQAIVDGNLVLGASAVGSMLTFDIHGIMPSTEKSSSTTILDVAGTLSLWDTTAVTINFSDINLSEHYNEDFTYYLASADSINIQVTGTQNASFDNQIISLGAGYYGKLSVVERKGSDSKWYLALNVVGDPRRTWSGMVSERNGSYISNDGQGLVWTTASSSINEDYQWKENDSYVDGLLTLFGNLYQPVKWVDSDTLTSSETVHVRGDKLHTGNPIAENESGFSIDGQSAAVEGFQKVEIVGTVRPAAIFIGSDYTLHSVTDGVVSTVGKNEHDDTNYYFYGTGKIAEAGDDVLHESFSGSSTSLRKMGYGTAVIATNNSFEGGTVLEGGRIVMQHYNALGTGEITIYNTTPADAEKQNIPILQGDFSDDRDAYGLAGLSSYVGEGMDTTTIHNTVNVLLQTGAQGGLDTERVAARIANAHDKKLVLSALKGDYGSIVSLYGHSKSSGQYSYAVFKVLDPSKFYGTIVMDGNILGAGADDAGGKVQCIAALDLRNKPWINEKLSAQPASHLPPTGKPSAGHLPAN